MRYKYILLSLLAGLTVTSCQLDEVEIPQEELYMREFIKQYGVFDQEQDWNIVTRVTANVNENLSGNGTICVYTAVPGGSQSYLAAEYPLQTKSFAFDYRKDKTDAYVIAKTDEGKVLLAGYYPIANGSLNIGGGNSRAEVNGTPSMTVGERIQDNNFGNIYDQEKHFESLNMYGGNEYYTDLNLKYTDIFELYRLNNVSQEKSDAGKWKISDWVHILGEDEVFGEQGRDTENRCNFIKWYDELHPEDGVVYTMSETGPVELSFMYGGTVCQNVFGYFYYTDDMSIDQITRTPRYILMDNATPHHNVKFSDGTALTDGMQLPGLVRDYENDYSGQGGNDYELTGTTYKLVYFGQDGKGEPTYNFPKGTHVGFFFIIDRMKTANNEGFNGGNMYYSLPWMNARFYKMHNFEYHTNDTGVNLAELGAMRFITYEWNGQIIMGLEDSDDHDMNDILFFVNGEFEEESTIPVINPDPIPDAQSFILAVEDLGNMDDFDFNDLVVEIAHASGQTTARANGLAAGGTLPINLLYNGTHVGPEFHSWFGIDNTSSMINTGAGSTATSNHYTIEVPGDFSMAYQEAEIQNNNMGGFTVVVTRSTGETTELVAPHKGLEAPQMICLPSEWRWPKERQAIDTAYPSFTNWITNHNNWDWLTTDVQENLLYERSSN